MAHGKDDLQSSIAGDSVFDWGIPERDGGDGGSGVVGSAPFLGGRAASPREERDSATSASPSPPSRYDPEAMSRIVDITDLVDDSNEDTDDDFEDVAEFGVARRKKAGRPGHRPPPRGRRIAMMTAIAAVVVGAAAAIGYVILNPGDGGDVLLRPARMGEGREGARQQMLLEAAERVAEACDVTAEEGDLGKCWELCVEKECCFDEEGSCKGDKEANCAAYAGCMALRAGSPLDDAEEDEERKDRG